MRSDFDFSRADIESAAAIVYQTLTPTPQFAWPLLAAELGAEVWVKHENFTPTGAFKVRGGLVYFDELLKGVRPSGVISATRGNHGQSVGFAARKHKIPATIVVPYGNSLEKNAAMRALGVELIEHGADFQASREYAAELAAERNLHMIPAFHPQIVRGVCTYALELLLAVPDLATVYVPVGQGSGISAMIAARDALKLKTEVVGVVSAHAPAYKLSFESRKSIEHAVTTELADGMACRVPDAAALDIIWRGAARILAVTDDEVAAAMRMYFSAIHSTAEGAGAAPLAGALQERARNRGRRIAVALTGGNVDRAMFARVLAG
ncbi:MAG: Pyridoxal-5-phosphate-dependent protein beta subunit [Betaproteobacteria bacterium]|nr:Pyridoxal-5-phosphate-dependent protein beta subunit [Betaproteobacteria bacterium]